ncbi:unnamed protein product, partial [Rotaria magnacalcarata]
FLLFSISQAAETVAEVVTTPVSTTDSAEEAPQTSAVAVSDAKDEAAEPKEQAPEKTE